MGRYFPYTLHPVSVAELARPKTSSSLIHSPARIDGDEWDSLWRFGGFPEPFLKAERNFHNQWSGLRDNQLFREDLRDLTRIQGLEQVETLAQLLRQRAGQLTSYASLAKTVRSSLDTARRWTATLEALYYCFAVRPWHHNVARALRKEPKYFLWDWSQVESPGARAENLVACALLKAVHWWTESGEGEFALHFVRDKQKREVDFLVAKDRRPWFLVEVKRGGNQRLSDSLRYFQKQTGATHAFQVVMDAEYVARDCFEHSDPVLVPGRTFLSQLV